MDHSDQTAGLNHFNTDEKSIEPVWSVNIS